MNGDKRLTLQTRFSGCGAKLGPGTLEKALCGLVQPAYENLIADFRGNEDAGLYRLGNGYDLVQTMDFFPPIVDDPFLYGRIAAANALSDVYAMGGTPITALALVCFPVRDQSLEVLRSMMEGGLDALIEAGCALLGGHSIEDTEPKLGYSVTGLVPQGKAWRNDSLVPGCALILTKPLGTGLVNMASRASCASPAALEASQRSMSSLNRAAAEVLAGFEVVACTDVTGFGLLGHASEMAAGERCGIRLFPSRVPLLPDALQYSAMGLVPEGTRRNKEGRVACVRNPDAVHPTMLDVLFDPQTSGGLLVAVPAEVADSVLAALGARGVDAAIIGESIAEAGVIELSPR